jgi:GNAT superfamily N-acetyltransferase
VTINRMINGQEISVAPRVNVYPATEEDVPRLLYLGHLFNEESGRQFDIDNEHWCRFWQQAIATDMGCAFYAATSRESDPVGMIMGIVYPSHIDQRLEVTESLWYLSKPYRRARTGIELLDALECFAELIGASRINMTHLANPHGRRIHRLFERRGYVAAECSYYKEVNQ